MSRAERLRCIEGVEAVRAAAGNGADLTIEGHGRFDVPTAIAVAQDIAPFHPTWFEEPLPSENIDALAEVRAKSSVAIATGERIFDPSRFAERIARRAADFLQPDIPHVGGLTGARQIARLAQGQFLPVCPHKPVGPVANAMRLHLAVATSNVAWLETMMTTVPWRGEVVHEDVRPENGRMRIPTAPGPGVSLNEAACADHTCRPCALRHHKGTLTGIRPAVLFAGRGRSLTPRPSRRPRAACG